MIYTIDEIRRRLVPVAEKYRLRAVYLFGSYARNEATDGSDVDLLVDIEGSIVKGWIMGGLYNDLFESMGKEIDLVSTGALEQESTKRRTPWFIDNVQTEKVKI